MRADMNAVSESYRASVNHGDSPFSLFSRRFRSLSGGSLSFFPAPGGQNVGVMVKRMPCLVAVGRSR